MPDTIPTLRRRWFRFGLRTMFMVLTVFSVWFGWNVQQVRQRNELEAWIRAQGGSIVNGQPTRPWKSLPWMWSLLGENSASHVILGGGGYTRDDLRRTKALFPEAHIQYSSDLRD